MASKRLAVLATLFFILVFHTCISASFHSSQSPPSPVDGWSCPFDSDFCDWEVGRAEAVHPAGPLVDVGWRIFSPHAGDQLSLEVHVDPTPRFAFLDTLAELRAEITSPSRNISQRDQIPGFLVTISYFNTRGASLSLYLVQNDVYKVLWVSGDLELHNETNSTSSNSWISVAQCVSLPAPAEGPDQEDHLKVSFIGHVEPNSSIGLRQLTVSVQNSVCTFEDNSNPRSDPSMSKTDDKAHAAWKILVVLSLFLCFGALFLATLVIVFGGFKNKMVNKRRAGDRRASEGEFVNPASQFDYQRLESL